MALAAKMEAEAGGVGHLEAHPTGAASTPVAGGLVGRDRASRDGGTDGARHTPAQTPAAAQAASEETQVRARPAPESNAEQQKTGGDGTLRRAGAMKSTTDEGMAERAPPEQQRALKASGRRGGAGTAQKIAGGYDTRRISGVLATTANEEMADRAPPEQPRALNASSRRGGAGTAQRTLWVDNNPWRERAAGRTANTAMAERAPPNGHERLTRAAKEGGKGEGQPHPMARDHSVQQGRGGGPPRGPVRVPPKRLATGHGRGPPVRAGSPGGPRENGEEEPS